MAKIPFDIKFRPQIESGEYKVETRDGRPVRIVCWDRQAEYYPLVALISAGKIEDEAVYTIDGKYVYDQEGNDLDLIIIVPDPEVEESEGERIRKDIVAAVEMRGDLTQGRKSEIYAYLEKQKEQTPNIELIQRFWYMEGYHDGKFGQEPKWIIKPGKGGPKYERNEKYRQPLEQKPTNSEKPKEWGEEDEKRVKQLIYDTEFIKAHYEKKKEELGGRFNNDLIRDCDEQIAWLKSIRPRPHWKPSEEQMKELKMAVDEQFDVDGGPLWDLYNDLKKLM